MAQGPEKIYIVPYTALAAIAQLISDQDASAWLATARGNVETRILAGEVVLSSLSRHEYQQHIDFLRDRRLEEEDAHRSVYDLGEVRDDGDVYVDEILEEARREARMPLYGAGHKDWDSDDSFDHDRALWKRWADSV